MNWLRDNILKILVVLGVLIVATVLIVLFATPKKDTPVIVSGTKYGEIENKLQAAAIKYINSHTKYLPATVDDSYVVELKTLQGNNYIGKLVSVDDASVKCDGYVEVTKLYEDSDLYRYTPYISCGNYYVTKTIGDYITDAETNEGTFNRTSDDGLYKIGDEYVFRGEKPNNYIYLSNHLYRIIKIDKDNQLQLISVKPTEGSYSWDNRYNVDTGDTDGINNFLKSRLNDSLKRIYDYSGEDAFFSSDEKTYIVPHDFCIGKRYSKDYNKYSGVECQETVSLNVGLLTLYEYPRASIDPNCINAYDAACVNYNYFNSLGGNGSYSYTTLTALTDNTYQVYKVSFTTTYAISASETSQLYPVIYINSNTIYSSGTGSASDPYLVR